MDGLLSFLCLLCVLITPGHSLSCTQCVGQAYCTGSPVTCLPNYSCGLAYRETTEGVNRQTDYIRSCVPKSQCKNVSSLSYTGGRMKTGISCCDTDICTPPPPQWPAESSVANGKVCPSCRSKTRRLCDQDTNIQCTGNEQTCLFQYTTTTVSDTVMGCATSTICGMEEYSYKTNGTYIAIGFYCFPATNSSATGTSCVICRSDDSLTCNSSLSVIPANSKCASAYLISTTRGMNSYHVMRSWVPVSKCNITGSMTVVGTKYWMGVSCCDGDGCTPSIQNTTSTSTVSNGVQCKLCAGSSCGTNTTTICTGQETQCVNYTTITTLGMYPSTSSFQGCGTKSLCDAQNISSTVNYLTVANLFSCESTTNNPSTTAQSNGGNSSTTPSNGKSGTTALSNGGNSTTALTNGKNGTTAPRNGGNGITALSNGPLVFVLLSTAATMFVLHQFNKDP